MDVFLGGLVIFGWFFSPHWFVLACKGFWSNTPSTLGRLLEGFYFLEHSVTDWIQEQQQQQQQPQPTNHNKNNKPTKQTKHNQNKTSNRKSAFFLPPHPFFIAFDSQEKIGAPNFWHGIFVRVALNDPGFHGEWAQGVKFGNQVPVGRYWVLGCPVGS